MFFTTSTIFMFMFLNSFSRHLRFSKLTPFEGRLILKKVIALCQKMTVFAQSCVKFCQSLCFILYIQILFPSCQHKAAKSLKRAPQDSFAEFSTFLFYTRSIYLRLFLTIECVCRFLLEGFHEALITDKKCRKGCYIYLCFSSDKKCRTEIYICRCISVILVLVGGFYYKNSNPHAEVLAT